MPTISKFPFIPLRRLRAEPNQLILHFSGGRLKRSGGGLAYWFSPLSAAIAMLPIEDCQTTFVLNERSADFQSVKVQCTLTYRISDPQKAAARFNFSVSIDSGAWLDKPLDRLSALMAQRSLPIVRQFISRQNLEAILRDGSEQVRTAIVQQLSHDVELAAMGVQWVGLVIDQIVPSAELEKALGTPLREAVQSRADEAQFQRRALAVEKERAIKENELATELELERRQQELISKRGENELLKVQQSAISSQAQQQAELLRQQAAHEARTQRLVQLSTAKAQAQRILDEQSQIDQKARHQIWAETPQSAAMGMALSTLATHLRQIGHLNITPDLLAQSFQQLLREQRVQAGTESAIRSE